MVKYDVGGTPYKKLIKPDSELIRVPEGLQRHAIKQEGAETSSDDDDCAGTSPPSETGYIIGCQTE